MRAEAVSAVDAIKHSIELLKDSIGWDKALAQLKELNAAAEDQNLWNDAKKAQELMQKRTRISQQVDSVRDIETALLENTEMIELAEEEDDEALILESENALIKLQAKAARAHLSALLSGDADEADAYLSINAGAGGTEAQDWAAMMARMYIRWAEDRGFKTQILEESRGEEAGIKSTTLKISGDKAYGWIKTEAGVHRLVRISPFDSGGRRHTSFASVAPAPVIDDSINIEIEDKDLRVDTYRSQGAGGQHVNTTDSAVRITHIPSGIVVACQSGRSQHKNRAEAMAMLRSKMYEAQMREKAQAAAAEHGEKTDIGWGHQIRSYVLQPYQMVKDVRTGIERTDPSSVLDGDIDDFLEAALAAK